MNFSNSIIEQRESVTVSWDYFVSVLKIKRIENWKLKTKNCIVNTLLNYALFNYIIIKKIAFHCNSPENSSRQLSG